MPLKSLELVGYKTFASKTTFEFADTITAVVGPNGSGKSNIADSIRWVLGEQSYSLLRGKKTIDMIFSGSQQRSPAGMASATVTFDNADGWLPIDFTEVAITRRAYRDGQNEYLINNQRVRLRDVAELLGHSGLSERTYTIIGQGLVDAALSLKAEERRKLFEEAAGIGVYRSRREEALKRLEKTRRNLERVHDILAELKPRLRSLDRQARRASEFEQIQTDLHVLLREWYGYHWHRQQTELTESKESARVQEKTLTETRAKQSSLAHQIRNLRDRIHDLRSMLGGWQEEISTLHNQRERISRELAVTLERQRALEERQTNTRAEQARLNEEVQLQKERLERSLEESETLRRRANEASSQYKEFQTSLDTQTVHQTQILESISEGEKHLSEVQSRISGQKARLEELKVRVKSLQAAQTDLEKNMGQGANEIEGLKQESKTAQEELEKRTGELSKSVNQSAENKITLQTFQEQQEKIRNAIREAATTAARLETQLEVLNQAEQSLSGYSAGSRLILEAGRDKRIPGVGSTISSILDVPAEFESAVTAALGVYLDAILIDSEVDAFQALDLLLSEKAGGAMLPIDQIKAISSDPKIDFPGSRGLLSNFVRSAEEFRPIIDLFLGRVVLVDDRSAASALRRKLPPIYDVVSLDGTMFLANGPIRTVGSSETGLVGRVRKRKELADSFTIAQAALENLRKEEVQIEAAFDSAKSKATADLAHLEETRIAENLARRAVEKVQAEIERVQSQLNWQQSQQSSQRAEVTATEQSVSAVEIGLNGSLQEAERLRNQLNALRAKLEEIPILDLQDQAAHWSTQVAVTQRAAEDARSRAEDRKSAAQDVSERLKSLDLLLKEIVSSKRSLQLEEEKLKIEQEQVRGQIGSARERIDPSESELGGLEAKLDTVQEAEGESRKELTASERNHSQAQILLARRQESLDNLREKVEDDFGLVAFEYADDISGPNPLPLGNFVEALPIVDSISAELGDSIKRQRAQLRRMGAINPDALQEFKEVSERHEFLTTQLEDLSKAESDILETVSELDILMEREFRITFDEVAREFRETFTRLFGGGSARLVLTDPDDMTDTGVDIEAQLPGRRTQGLSLLSGGERSLTATALVLSLIKVSPTPFCVLDEVDAMLDEANVNRLAELLRELSTKTQFIVITHNRNTVQTAELIYGITMGRDSTSQVIGLKLDEVADLV